MTEQLLEAANLMGVGMTVVFAFLTLLIGGIHGVAWFSNLFPEAPIAVNKSGSKYNKNKRSTPTTVDPKVVVAITAAIHAHRRNKQ